jgi:hypothetical protein
MSYSTFSPENIDDTMLKHAIALSLGQDPVLAHHSNSPPMETGEEEFLRRAVLTPPAPEVRQSGAVVPKPELIDKLMGMGFDEADASAVLIRTNNQLKLAVEHLLS